MSCCQFLWSETSPASAITTISSQVVANAASWAPAGVAAPLDGYDSWVLAADLVGGTGGTLDVSVWMSPDQGLNWYEVAHLPQQASGGAAKSYVVPISLYVNPTTAVQVGKGTASVLSAGTICPMAIGDRLRLTMTGGSGTSAGVPVTIRLLGQRSRGSAIAGGGA
jgi:hypothetical protein